MISFGKEEYCSKEDYMKINGLIGKSMDDFFDVRGRLVLKTTERNGRK